jgi:hypothetical protein
MAHFLMGVLGSAVYGEVHSTGPGSPDWETGATPPISTRPFMVSSLAVSLQR